MKRLTSCWAVPKAALNSQFIVRVSFTLKPDGTLTSLPKVLNSSTHPMFISTSGSAVRAVVDCQPYDFLPADQYDLWRDNTIDFDPHCRC
ncbi:MAG: energy transducer TonB [Hyphomicrobiales bacterium]